MIDGAINDGKTVAVCGSDMVLAAYGLAADTPESAIVAHLFKLYAEMAKKGDKP